jgi:hypothetical protein
MDTRTIKNVLLLHCFFYNNCFFYNMHEQPSHRGPGSSSLKGKGGLLSIIRASMHDIFASWGEYRGPGSGVRAGSGSVCLKGKGGLGVYFPYMYACMITTTSICIVCYCKGKSGIYAHSRA